MKVFRGNLVLTDSDSEIGPATILVEDDKIVEVIKGKMRSEEWNSLTNVEQVHI